MLVDEGKYYLYRHVRLDTNQPFYIGIGTKNGTAKTHLSQYVRAHAKSGRNDYWKKIINNTPYKVEILLESDSHSFIEEKEKEFIKLYGRKSDNGPLCNMEGGGVRGIDRNFMHKKVYCCNNRKWHESLTHASEFYNVDRASVIKVSLNQANHIAHLVFSTEECDCVKIEKEERLADEYCVDVVGFEGKYLISNLGRLFSIVYSVSDDLGNILRYKDRLISPVIRKDRLQISLSNNDKYYTHSLKKIVYCSFNNIPLNSKVNLYHLNSNFSDCNILNIVPALLFETRNRNKNTSSIKENSTGTFTVKFDINLSRVVETFNDYKSAENFYNNAIKSYKEFGKLPNKNGRCKFSSNHKGVSYSKRDKVWISYAQINKTKRVYFGPFINEQDAFTALEKYKKENGITV